MGCLHSTTENEQPTTKEDPLSHNVSKKEDETITRDHEKKFISTHSKQYERYFNRQFKVSVCSAQGERRKMEDDHLCRFIMSKHPNYSLFGVFDGHNGSLASKYLAENLYKVLNDLSDLENNENIISAIKTMDKQYLSTSDNNTAGSTIVFVIVSSDFDSVINTDTIRATSIIDINNDINTKPHPFVSKLNKHVKLSKFSYGASDSLPGFEKSYNARVFWCGDSRGYLVHTSEFKKGEDINFNVLTHDHDTTNEMEIKRVKKGNGNIINGRIDGKLMVTRSFGDSRIKYDGSVVIAECEYNKFEVNVGDSLLLCCDGLVEKWNDKILMNRLMQHLNDRNNNKNNKNNKNEIDTCKAIGCLVDDAIYEGSTDNISAMLVEFNDGTKQKTHSKYQNVKTRDK